MADDKVHMDHDGLEHQRIVGAPLTHVDPAAEARVRHKLDWNLMPLLFILCKSQRNNMTNDQLETLYSLTHLSRSARRPRPRKHWQRHHRRHGERPQDFILRIPMAPNNLLHHICRIRILHSALEDLPSAHSSRSSHILLVSQLSKSPATMKRREIVPGPALILLDLGV